MRRPIRMGDRRTTHDRTIRARRSGRHRRRRGAAIGTLLGALALSACSTGDDDSADEPAAATVQLAAEEPADAAAPNAGDAAATEASGTTPTGATDLDLGVVGRDVIIEMHVVLSSDDIGRSVATISASASQLGGGVASSSVDYGDPSSSDRTGHAVLVVKVPPDRLDRLLTGLDATGTVRSIEQSAQDVTEQLVDLDVRIDNARESVANVRDFMERADDLGQLVTLESELTMRQTELERLEAQQRNLSERVALSTVTIEIVPASTAPDVVDDDEDSLGDAVSDGWQAFATFLFAVVYVLAVLLPFVALAASVGVIVWLLVRRRRRSADAGPSASAPDGPDGSGDDLVGAVSGGESANRPE